ncbi:MAG TPA: hypothetical protein VF944_10850 [Candidatus Bathyarchaeia archaeon]
MADKVFPTFSIKVDTPDGRMFVHILENDGLPVQVLINIGKSGTNLSAWADAVSRMVSQMLKYTSIYVIIEELSGITSSRFIRLAQGEVIRSGPEGVAYALVKYRNRKYKDNRPKDKPGRASIE